MATKQELTETLSRVEKLTQHSQSLAVHPPAPEIDTLTQKFSCLMMPETKTTRFFDRVDVFARIDALFESKTEKFSFRSVALHGLGGVGKSSIASSYIERKYDEGVYSVVLWARSETLASLKSSFTEIALKLKLPGAQPRGHDENLVLVQEWFQSTGSSPKLTIIIRTGRSSLTRPSQMISGLLCTTMPSPRTCSRGICHARPTAGPFSQPETEIYHSS